jgi:hypothetical protein
LRAELKSRVAPYFFTPEIDSPGKVSQVYSFFLGTGGKS